MDRQGRGRPPHRQSSLPSSLHRFMVPGPSQPRRSTTQEGDGRTSPEGGEEPLRLAPSPPAHPIPSAPLIPHQQLPTTILTQAVFEETTEIGESAGRQSISPAPGTVSRDPGFAARPALTIPLPPPSRGILRSDPAYFASMPTYPATYSIPPPGPPLPPISWTPPRAPGESSLAPPLATPDRRDPVPPPQFFSQPPPRPASYSPSSPVAGPSRPRDEPPRRRRRGKGPESQPPVPPQEAGFSSGATPEPRVRRGSGDTPHELGSTSGSRAPSSGVPVEGSDAIQRGARPVPPQAQGARGSPASSLTDNFPVAVGSTAYHVSTLSPLRATVLSPVNEPGPSAPDASPAAAAEPATATQPQEPAAQPEPAPAAVAPGKRTRRTRGEKDKSSGSSESSEHAHAPKSKKTPIACHFCRGPGRAIWTHPPVPSVLVSSSELTSSSGTVARKLRCDGQKPSCANCTKRSHPCTYEQQPKRRGPGKTPRGSSRKRGRQAGTGAGSGSGAEAGRSPAAGRASASASAREATGRAEASSAHTPEIAGPAEAAPAPGLSPSLPHTQPAFEPQLTGPVPTYPGFAYRPPSPSSSYPPGWVDAISYNTSRPGPSRQSESVHSTTSSAPSVPESEESAYNDHEPIDYEELEEFYRQPHPGQAEEPPP
ncbi:hypothetical protein L226DRAFT_521379 [Lentinus tigrinus ALCF2SS1-7]|uniref:uncharacterized protein n=1 Tax=Lentinus tigrinus ALCF2SS1-7 TaxID=1328758 RepID=UPI00116620E4|nr:hypothetical protein L226DRAFT_521379 [Lentinus tigrinus ALCF2SS1-7]